MKIKEIRNKRIKLVTLLLLIKVVLAWGGCLTFPDPEQRVIEFWSAYKEGDFEKAEDYVLFEPEEVTERIWSQGDNEIFNQEMVQNYIERVSITTKGHEIDNYTARVEVSVTWPDQGIFMEKLMVEAVPKAFSAVVVGADEEEVVALLKPLFIQKLEETPLVNTSHMVSLQMKDREWKLVDPPVPYPEKVFDLPREEDRTTEVANSLYPEEDLEGCDLDREKFKSKDKSETSLEEPAGLGDQVTICFQDAVTGEVELEMELLETLRGDKAWEKVQKASPSNDSPPEGKEYILARFRSRLKEAEGEGPLTINHFMFETVSGRRLVYENYSTLAGLEPDLSVDLYEGEEHEGWTYFLVKESDNPFAVFKRGKEGEAWFALR
ncbi:MAG: hypothetical protein D5R97_02900 [Candidatus Syntrophonatronum acetioxidans]|uniref:Uncharacterized protein n=1 Tax=Candidatus Syntrophonatronum acetioxidans TaxID=1795816 RepID=A0A424YGR5_9FIRM|nr:MAG: hypothetical protein D5R97_02900 [Candidatus Syntrophonatronum acetioxidans]